MNLEARSVSSGRCLGCCQENCQDCSCSCHKKTKLIWEVKKEDVVLFWDSDRETCVRWMQRKKEEECS